MGSSTPLTLSPTPRQQFIDANGNPYAGAQLFTYQSGTTTKLVTYGGFTGSTPNANTNPVILNASGECVLYLEPAAYKFVLAPANDTDPPTSPIWTTDPVGAVPTTTVDVDIEGTAGEDLIAGMPVFMSAGSGGNTAGRWYRSTAGSADGSIGALVIGFVPSTIASGASGSIRIVGRITGLSALTPGTVYYAALTPGGTLTSTPPANARIWGIADTATSIIIAPQRPNDVRRVSSFQTPVGNIGAGEDTLASYSSGAEGIFGDGMGWDITFFGLTTNTAAAKTLRLRVIEGANNNIILSSALTVNETGRWHLTATIVRLSGTTFSAGASIISGPANTAATFVDQNVTSAATATFANAVEIRLTGEATNNDDIIMTAGMIQRIGIGR